ncbi:hypothetical protein CR513_45929, partial [Mucuna pruriens]
MRKESNPRTRTNSLHLSDEGMYGGVAHLNKAQLTPLKKGWCLIATAPIVDPSLIVESFTKSCVIKSLAGPGIMGSLGNSRARATMLARVSSCSSPLNGVIP